MRRNLEGINQALIEKALRKGDIRVNGAKAKSSHRLNKGDVVTAKNLKPLAPLPQKLTPPTHNYTPEDLAYLESLIIWEDDDLCVINKPQGLAVQGGTNTPRHLDGLLRAYEKSKSPSSRYLLVHRLDRDTSGVWVVAKTHAMARHLAECFEQGLVVEKTYWCLVEGTPNPSHSIIEAPLLKTTGKSEKVIVSPKEGKKALTHYRVIKKLGALTWVECRPKTGRTHQIRVHMQHIGTPILGDKKYGSQVSYPLCLHARSLSFPDLEGNRLTFSAHPPTHITNKFTPFSIRWEEFT